MLTILGMDAVAHLAPGLHQSYAHRTQKPANLDHRALEPLGDHTPLLWR